MIFMSAVSVLLMNVVMFILYKGFLGNAVYKDATENQDRNAGLWAILVIIFGWIPLVIYIIMRYQKEKEMISCPHCGNIVSKKFPVCMFCKQPINKGKKKPIISDEVKRNLIIATAAFIIHKILVVISSHISAGPNFFYFF